MKFLLQITLCVLLAGPAMAQRGGGGSRGGGGGGFHGGGGGGFHGGGSIGGGGFRGGGVASGGFRGGYGGSYGGGFRGGIGGGFRGGFGGFRGGFGGFRNGFGFNRGRFGLGFYGGYWPYWGYGYGGYWPGYYDSYPYDYYSPYDYGYGYASYNTSPNVTVVYPQQTQASGPVYVDRATPVMRQYDEYGQEVAPSGGGGGGSPIYLIAFQDHVIRAAASYWVEGKTLHYVTLQHEEKQTPLDSVDRGFSMRLNRERHVQLQLPQ
jgi:hypothetical protein